MIGAVLAGGLGRRLGAGSKPAAALAGRPLIAWPVEALGEVCVRVAVVCKRDTTLPELSASVERWDEPDEPRHPLTGIAHALERAGEPVLVCAADMPFVDPRACRLLLRRARTEPPACVVVAEADGRIQPVFAVYRPQCLDALRAAAPGAPLTATVLALGPARVSLPSRTLRGVNTPEDIRDAGAEVVARGVA